MWGRAGRQYPGEKEITFPPYTCLESDGEPRVERSAEGEIVVFPLKVSSPRTQPAPSQAFLAPSRRGWGRWALF